MMQPTESGPALVRALPVTGSSLPPDTAHSFLNSWVSKCLAVPVLFTEATKITPNPQVPGQLVEYLR